MNAMGEMEVKESLIGELHLLKEISGYSAYELAVKNGFKGTQKEWLESLTGPKGEPGRTENFQRRLTADDDLNDVRAPGWYYFTTDSLPENSPFQNAGIVEVVCDDYTEGRILQRVTRYGAAGHTAFRTLHEGSWLEWRKPAVIWQKDVTGTTNENGNITLNLSENYIVLGIKGHNYEIAIPYFYPSIGWRANLMSASDLSRLSNVSTTLTVYYSPV